MFSGLCFAVTRLGILVVRVSPSLEDHRIAAELPIRWVSLGKISACVTGGRVTGTAELTGSVGGIGGAARVADALVSGKFFAAETETGLDTIAVDAGTELDQRQPQVDC